jgi:hypothetical protein
MSNVRPSGGLGRKPLSASQTRMRHVKNVITTTYGGQGRKAIAGNIKRLRKQGLHGKNLRQRLEHVQSRVQAKFGNW